MTTTESTMRLAEVKPSEIATHPRNPRRLIEVADLVASVKSDGVLEPLIVAPWPDTLSGTAAAKKKHLLIAGHRRLAAAKAAKLSTVPVIVREDLDTEDKQLEAMLVENVHRSDLTPVEEGQAYQQLLEFPGFTQARLAADLGLPKTRIRDRVKIAKLPLGVQDRIHDGQVSLTEALEVATFADNADTMAKLEKAAGTNNFNVELASAKAARKREQDWRSLLKQIRDAGYVELDDAEQDVAAEPGTRTDGAREVRKIPGLYSYTWNVQDAWAAEKRVHGDCPHRGVVIREHPGQVLQNGVTFYCTKPDVHNQATADAAARRGVEDTDLPETDEARAAREQAEAERAENERARAELQTTLDAAADVRLEHLAGMVNHKTGDEDLARRLTARWLLAEENENGLRIGFYDDAWKVTAGLFGIDPNDHDPDDCDPRAVVDQRRYLVEQKLSKATLPALAIITAVSYWLCDGEPDLRRGLMPTPGEWSAGWVNILTDDLAYVWSDFEKDHFGLTPDGHVPDEGGDDE